MNFSPYQPPPDVPSTDPPEVSTKSKPKSKRPWFTRDPSSYNASSYQSGGTVSDPTAVPQAYTNDPESAAFLGSAAGGGALENDRANAWESRFGWRVDVMAAAAYLGGPVTALLFLILETRNDYVRFHGKLSLSSPNVYACSDRSAAYQSALLTTPLLVLLLLFNLLIPLPAFLRTFFIVVSVGGTLYAAFRAWKDAQEGLERFWLPYIGPVAERWVSEE
ncbi:hypothetical protein I307_02482 [Cryptococcus deuterogattii 99/473]|uniref:Uncharacterized protein n=2 Tax=Cryptococcus deuterogattii TaxID=1859096 RepID=A0A0D0USL6_9TREE|nr:hypothetical protein I309_02121 [Cryptococcus deuterogattii LA55]KIR38191.1 hypothetical protein I313_05761 [Cryptococcus deuterogattii Ram5]KIR73669.1 hypothetical protein I310_02342 [Cryptococcus deuterogattii CA1014]KIR93160.1 hypothetical protein I304_02824 [Cryptococcus deuterogattii CBS 10090]KIY58231.1 hypothetical protein I307_02482 [Cryptococcus deuterogattii 99/473]KNX49802.1 hypothetical protein CNBG_9580 [Cryptococcus deuterogattii R265]